MRDFLVNEGDVKDVSLVETAYLTYQEFQERIVSVLARAQNEPLLILFCGHGSRVNGRKRKNAGWSLSDARRVFSYYELACILRDHPAPVYIVNSACFAFGIVRELKRVGCSPRRVSVLASSAANRFSYGGLVEKVVASWRGQEPLLGAADEVPVPRQVKSVRKKERFERWLGNMLYRINEKIFLAVCDRLYDEQAVWVTSKKELPGVKRWGVFLDYHFFPKQRLLEGTICIPEIGTAGK